MFITFDESCSSDPRGCCHYAQGARVLTVVVGQKVRRGYVSTAAYDPYSLLLTIEQA